LQGETTIQEVLSVTASERSFAEAKPTLKPNAPASRAMVAAAP